MSTPSGADVPGCALRFLSAKSRQRCRGLGTHWRRPSVGRQVLPARAHLRNGHPQAHLVAGSGIGTTTAHRYVTKAVEALAALAPSLAEAVRTASSKAFVLLEGALLPIDRTAANGPLSPGKHKRHGMGVQVLAAPLRPAAVGPTGLARGRPRRSATTVAISSMVTLFSPSPASAWGGSSSAGEMTNGATGRCD